MFFNLGDVKKENYNAMLNFEIINIDKFHFSVLDVKRNDRQNIWVRGV